ncbi:hypothetical protein KIPB_009110, partial [Kipferlia bialata]
GSAIVYTQDGTGVFTETQVLEGTIAKGYFGASVATAGNQVAVGATGVSSSTGAAYVYTNTDGDWDAGVSLPGPATLAHNNRFGSVLDMSLSSTGVSTVVVGTGYSNTVAMYQASAVGMDYASVDAFPQQQDDYTSYGRSLALFNDDSVVIGSPVEDTVLIMSRVGTGADVAYEQHVLTGPCTYCSFGSDVSIAWPFLSVGAEDLTLDNVKSIGAVYIYDISDLSNIVLVSSAKGVNSYSSFGGTGSLASYGFNVLAGDESTSTAALINHNSVTTPVSAMTSSRGVGAFRMPIVSLTGPIGVSLIKGDGSLLEEEIGTVTISTTPNELMPYPAVWDPETSSYIVDITPIDRSHLLTVGVPGSSVVAGNVSMLSDVTVRATLTSLYAPVANVQIASPSEFLPGSTIDLGLALYDMFNSHVMDQAIAPTLRMLDAQQYTTYPCVFRSDSETYVCEGVKVPSTASGNSPAELDVPFAGGKTINNTVLFNLYIVPVDVVSWTWLLVLLGFLAGGALGYFGLKLITMERAPRPQPKSKSGGYQSVAGTDLATV